jgi:3'5'-cyclic nucleotide phosphodiesterase
MESTGSKSRIHASAETANSLIRAGKSHWVTPREAEVDIKGKGKMQTFWISLDKTGSQNESKANSDTSGSENASMHQRDTNDDIHEYTESGDEYRDLSSDMYRLVQWNSDVLAAILKQVIAFRQAVGVIPDAEVDLLDHEDITQRHHITPRNEMVEVIHLPEYDGNAAANQTDPEAIILEDAVTNELFCFVAAIASMYRGTTRLFAWPRKGHEKPSSLMSHALSSSAGNPFHNFEHASHVILSTVKLLSRIVAPDFPKEGIDFDKDLHDHTYGITSDPLTQFSCVFASLIHDVDHSGVPNTQLARENSSVAAMYHGTSLAEQNSFDLAWKLLMDEQFYHLRRAIYVSVGELKRFRQLVLNSVMATDIMDKDLKELRNRQWDRAFNEKEQASSLVDSTNYKATVVMNHLIQASDVAHTMQHWHVYRKWNARLYHEMHQAYRQGRADCDPAKYWYQRELGFFDFYVIPLAKKLHECGVFGVSGDEYLQYAEMNRKEWETRGEEIVAEMALQFD